MEFKNAKVIAKPASDAGVSSRGPWKKAYAVLRYEDGQYPKDIIVSNMKKAEDFERIPAGATGDFNVDGTCRRASNGKWYMDLNCWSWKLNQVAQGDNDPI